MFNDSLTLEQCTRLVEELAETALPFQCAHGRYVARSFHTADKLTAAKTVSRPFGGPRARRRTELRRAGVTTGLFEEAHRLGKFHVPVEDTAAEVYSEQTVYTWSSVSEERLVHVSESTFVRSATHLCPAVSRA